MVVVVVVGGGEGGKRWVEPFGSRSLTTRVLWKGRPEGVKGRPREYVNLERPERDPRAYGCWGREDFGLMVYGLKP